MLLSWFVSGMLQSRIQAQEAGKRVLEMYDRWQDQVSLYGGRWKSAVEQKTAGTREEFRGAVRDYDAMREAGSRGWDLQGAIELARAEQPLECSGWIDAGLRPRVENNTLRHVLKGKNGWRPSLAKLVASRSPIFQRSGSDPRPHRRGLADRRVHLGEGRRSAPRPPVRARPRLSRQ